MIRKKPAAFTSVSKLYQSIRQEGQYDISFDKIKWWGRGQDIITLNAKPVQRTSPQRKVMTDFSRHSLWDTDLLQISEQ